MSERYCFRYKYKPTTEAVEAVLLFRLGCFKYDQNSKKWKELSRYHPEELYYSLDTKQEDFLSLLSSGKVLALLNIRNTDKHSKLYIFLCHELLKGNEVEMVEINK
jgi:hypothetical protein